MKWTQIDSVWILVAACLVLFMQAGFAAREAGIGRSKNGMSVAAKIIGGIAVTSLVFWIVGFSVMRRLDGADMFLSADSDPGVLAVFLYEVALACIPAAILSGAVAERIRLAPFLVIVAIYGAAVYPLFGHWTVGGGGWLGNRGFVDGARATSVHAMGGFLALAGVLIVGPRAGRFDAARRATPIPGSSLPLAILGTFILWLGFLAAAGGTVVGDGLARVLVNGIVSGAAGGLIALAMGWSLRKKPQVELPMTGVLAGLVAISGCGHAVATPAALIIGGVAGGLSLGIERGLTRAALDDATSAIPIHLGGGLWGTLAVGLFGDPHLLGTGLSRGLQLKAQLEGLLTAGIFGFAASFGLFKLVGMVMRLRITPEEEAAGLNASEQGAT